MKGHLHLIASESPQKSGQDEIALCGALVVKAERVFTAIDEDIFGEKLRLSFYFCQKCWDVLKLCRDCGHEHQGEVLCLKIFDHTKDPCVCSTQKSKERRYLSGIVSGQEYDDIERGAVA